MAGQTVLIVDDDAATAELYAGFLERSGISAAVRSDGAGALSYLETRPADAVVTDMRMPGMDGAELLREVRRRHRGTRVLIISGSGLNGAELKLQGAMDVLTKPVALAAFYAAVASALAEKRTTRRLPFQVPVTVEGTAGSSLDVSADGMLVKSAVQLPAGRELRVAFGRDGSSVAVAGRVLRSRTINSLYYTALHFAGSVGEVLVRQVRGAWAPSPA